MKRLSWIAIAVIVLVVLLVFMVGTSLLGGRGWGCSGGWGMMEPWMYDGTPGAWGFRSLGWLGMIFMWLVPLGVLGLAVVGIGWLVRELSSKSPAVVESVCPSCGRDVHADWLNCPICGSALKGK
jgi:hypothetical protein